MSRKSSSSLSAKDEHSNEEDVPSSSSETAQQDVEKGSQQGPSASTKSPAQDDAFRVDWEENDRANPRNWSPWYKAFLTFQYGMLALCGSMASSIISPAGEEIAREFGLRRLTTVLTVSLNVLGFALGPCLWAPLSEVYGRKISMLPAVFVLALFSVGGAVSQTPEALFITRFFAGVFGSAPISNVPGALGDLYEPRTRGIAVTFYAIAVAGGPTAGVVIGAALTAGAGWRWTEYFEAIWTAFVLLLGEQAYTPYMQEMSLTCVQQLSSPYPRFSRVCCLRERPDDCEKRPETIAIGIHTRKRGSDRRTP